MWGMAGEADIVGKQVKYWLDTAGCQSGSGQQSTRSSKNLVVGVHAYGGKGVKKNHGPKLHSKVYWFIHKQARG